MDLNTVRTKYLNFFKVRDHAVLPSASLVPENDPTTLFTGSGMQPMVPYLLGEVHPQGTRLADSQKCFRSGDIEEVGDNRHTTFFEMLGNWSLGDYGKEEQLPWLFDFLVGEIGLDPNRLFVTVFAGDTELGISRDTESVELLQKLFADRNIEAQAAVMGSEEEGAKRGMREGERIFYYDATKNWWSRSGVPKNMPVGEPGGPDSEVFYDFGTEHDLAYGEHCHPNCDCGRFLEIGNSVFMKYQKEADGNFSLLPKPNVDFGGGLERIVMAATNTPDIIAMNHAPIVSYVESCTGKTYGEYKRETRAFRIIADHIKAAVFLIADGALPSNTDQGYFVRRLIRRAVRYADVLGVSGEGFAAIVEPVVEMYQEAYPALMGQSEHVATTIADEEKKFRKTLKRGLKKLQEHTVVFEDGDELPASIAFDLFTTYGFPYELVVEEVSKWGMSFNKADFEKKMREHQALSRLGAEQKFKGGLADHSDMSVKYHTATHLLHQALRTVLGDHVHQKGSNITPERLRFDFSHSAKMTPEERAQVEQLVNEQIQAALPVTFEDVPVEEAKKSGATGLFEEKYGDTVRVYTIGDFSKELCGGPHVGNTGELGTFKIKKEEASAAGIRRIKAVLTND